MAIVRQGQDVGPNADINHGNGQFFYQVRVNAKTFCTDLGRVPTEDPATFQ